MSDRIVFGMLRTFETYEGVSSADAMRAALRWLAENVSDEMIDAATKALYELPGDLLTPDARKHMFRAALLKASESGE